MGFGAFGISATGVSATGVSATGAFEAFEAFEASDSNGTGLKCAGSCNFLSNLFSKFLSWSEKIDGLLETI